MGQVCNIPQAQGQPGSKATRNLKQNQNIIFTGQNVCLLKSKFLGKGIEITLHRKISSLLFQIIH